MMDKILKLINDLQRMGIKGCQLCPYKSSQTGWWCQRFSWNDSTEKIEECAKLEDETKRITGKDW